jgi:cyclopropane-fatty-acyl-phospholipid synthase
MSLINKFLSELISEGQVTLISPGLRAKHFGSADSSPNLTVRFADRKVGLQIARNPPLGFGEAYMDGRVQIEGGSLLDLLEITVGSKRWEDRAVGQSRFSLEALGDILARFRRNPADRSRRNVAHHYDLSDDLYDLFLNGDRQYSCAYYFDPENSLERAQADKKAHIAAKLYLKPGQRVLDIGCGWGGMAIYLNQVAGVEVLGITLSEEQLKVARRQAEAAGVANEVKFELIDYRSLTGTFDRIVSVGMFEHVGAAHYDEFFAKCRSLLKDDGVMLLHTIGLFGMPGSPDPFTEKWIFPGHHLPSLSQVLASSEKVRLIASDVETLRLHYAYTLREWLRRCLAEREKIVALYDERFFRMWEFYLAGGIVMFERGAACNYQIQYVRDRYALPITRDYLAQAERDLAERQIDWP